MDALPHVNKKLIHSVLELELVRVLFVETLLNLPLKLVMTEILFQETDVQINAKSNQIHIVLAKVLVPVLYVVILKFLQ